MPPSALVGSGSPNVRTRPDVRAGSCWHSAVEEALQNVTSSSEVAQRKGPPSSQPVTLRISGFIFKGLLTPVRTSQ